MGFARQLVFLKKNARGQWFCTKVWGCDKLHNIFWKQQLWHVPNTYFKFRIQLWLSKKKEVSTVQFSWWLHSLGNIWITKGERKVFRRDRKNDKAYFTFNTLQASPFQSKPIKLICCHIFNFKQLCNSWNKL